MNSWTISRRIIFGFAVILLISAALGGFALWELQSISQSVVVLADMSLPSVLTLDECAALARDNIFACLQYSEAGSAEQRTARFRCVIALATPGGKLHYSEGICPGEVIPEERGSSGFGYDPIFLVREKQRTMAELSLDEKNQLSHRARAIHGIRPFLLYLLAKS